jgi:hypothetical protein
LGKRSIINWPLAIILVGFAILVWGIVYGYW